MTDKTTWPVEFIANGETQIMADLTEDQIHDITNRIKAHNNDNMVLTEDMAREFIEGYGYGRHTMVAFDSFGDLNPRRAHAWSVHRIDDCIPGIWQWDLELNDSGNVIELHSDIMVPESHVKWRIDQAVAAATK